MIPRISGTKPKRRNCTVSLETEADADYISMGCTRCAVQQGEPFYQ
jgi:hypothetical protein